MKYKFFFSYRAGRFPPLPPPYQAVDPTPPQSSPPAPPSPALPTHPRFPQYNSFDTKYFKKKLFTGLKQFITFNFRDFFSRKKNSKQGVENEVSIQYLVHYIRKGIV